ncbi:MAG: response regulator transcription factor [Mariniblastus sp.]
MTQQNTPTLLASVSNEGYLDQLLALAAAQLKTEFITSNDIQWTLGKCERFQTTCTVVDFEKTDLLQYRTVARRFCNDHTLLVVIPEGDTQAAFQAGSLGAVNVIEKPIKKDEVVANLQSALASETKLKEISQDQRFDSLAFAALTAREKAILHLLMEGEPNKRVAAILDIGLRTVESDRAQLMKKLSASTFVELISFVTRSENNLQHTRKDIFSRILPSQFKHQMHANN